jgi:hypothetical protein
MGQIENLGRLLQTGSTLKLACGACGRRAEYDRVTAWRTFSMNATPHSLRRRLKCTQCSERSRINLTV